MKVDFISCIIELNVGCFMNEMCRFYLKEYETMIGYNLIV